MFCPLCKTEYRPGFSTCSDCRSELVGTEEEAQKTLVLTFWKGGDQRRFESLLTMLQTANIPCRFKQGVSLDPHLRIKVMGITVVGRGRGSNIKKDFEIRILQKDLARARLEEREDS